MKKVTIGLPFFNSETTLDLSIKSVINQSNKDWILVLINDGSTDSSNDIAEKYFNTNENIIYINDGKNLGLIYRLNQIIDLTKTKYIARMDSDDIMMPDRIEKQLDILERKPEIDVVSSSVYSINDNNDVIGLRDYTIHDYSIETVFRKKFIAHPTVMARAEWYKLNKYYNFMRAEDLELWIRSFNHTNHYRIKKPLLLYREGKVSISNYLKTSKTFINILNIHGKKYFNNFKLLRFKINSNFKSLIYYIFSLFNAQDILARSRSLEISNDKINSVKKYINKLQG
jgi:glycosyltransferase involved in cell wall biosynthesis